MILKELGTINFVRPKDFCMINFKVILFITDAAIGISELRVAVLSSLWAESFVFLFVNF